jgi:hypothetical protein
MPLGREWGAPMPALSRVASTVAAAFERMSPIAACLALLVSIPAVSQAQGGRFFVECVDVAQPQDTLSVVLDFDRQAVAGAFPINWAWFTGKFVLFQYSTLINGHQHVLQSYTLDRATGAMEICDFAAGQEDACRRRPCALGQWDGKATLPAAARAPE